MCDSTVRKFVGTIPAGSTKHVVEHNLDTKDYVYSIYDDKMNRRRTHFAVHDKNELVVFFMDPTDTEFKVVLVG